MSFLLPSFFPRLRASAAAVWGAITGTLSDQTDLQTALDAKAASVHNHSAAEIISGTLVLARGGTGSSLTDPNADRILFWDDSGNAVDWLTLGSGLSITGTTLNSTASGITEYRFTADSDTGFDNPSANQIQTVLGGTPIFTFLISAGVNTIRGIDGSGSSSGSGYTFLGGTSGGSGGNGGGINITGGTAQTNGFGGTIAITGGVSSTGDGGAIVIKSGAGGSITGHVTLATQNGAATNIPTGGLDIITGDPLSGNANSGTIQIGTGGKAGSGIAGNIEFYVDNTFCLRLNGTSKHLSHRGSAPSITAGGGTSPSIVGKDEAFLVTIGTGGVATSVEVTFANAFTNAPICVTQSDTDIVAFKVVSTTTKVTITATAPFTAGSKLHVISRGYE